MSSLRARPATSPRALLLRILERPELVSAVRELPAPVLLKLVDQIGLEDAGELIALASTEQLEHLLDEDLWKAAKVGDDETFRPERFALWLRVMLEGGEEFLARRLAELPQDLLALAIHRLVLVIDMDVMEEQLGASSEELARDLEKALEGSVVEEWEELRLIARDPDSWDDIWHAILLLDRDDHDRLRAILEQCCAMSTEYISGQGGLFEVLSSGEMLEADVTAAREDRRAAEGFVSPADARSFLELARRGDVRAERDPITRAYFRGLSAPKPEKPESSPEQTSGMQLAAATGLSALVSLLEEAAVIGPDTRPPLAALMAGQPKRRTRARPAANRAAPVFERAMRELGQRDPKVFFQRIEELGYLVNVWMAAGEHDGKRPRPVEALETVLRTCEAGLRAHVGAKRVKPEQALSVLRTTPADRLFREGFRERVDRGKHR